jgi:hypothetical protein
MARRNRYPRRGRKTFRLVFLLIVLTGIAAWAYPVLRQYFPEETAIVERLRGAYDGPVLAALPAGAHGFQPGRTELNLELSDEASEYFFVPAANRSYYVSALSEYLDDVRVDLFDPADGEVLDSNTNYPAFSGRHADMWADSGEEPELSHSPALTRDLEAGRLYGVRITAESPTTLGTGATVEIGVEDTTMDIFSLWGILAALLVALAIASLFLRYALFGSPRRR